MTRELSLQSSEAPAKKKARVVRRVLQGVGIGLFAVLLLIAALLLFVQTEPGRERIRSIAVSQVQTLLAEDATVSIQRLDGNFLSGARLLGLTIDKGGQRVIEVDTAHVQYGLLPLLWRTFSAPTIEIGGLRVWAHQRDDGSFDVADLLREDEEPTEEEGKPFMIQIGSLQLARGELAVTFWPSDADSTLRIDELTLNASNFLSGSDTLQATIDQLGFNTTAPHEAAELSVEMAGTFSNSGVSLPELQITSRAGTRVTGSGDIAFREGAPPNIDLDIAATPLELADIRALSGAPVQGAPTIQLTSNTNDQNTVFSLESSLDEARLAINGRMVSNSQNGGARYVVDGELARFNPSDLIDGPSLDALLNGTLNADLSGDSLQTLNGSLSLSLAESRVGDQVIDAFNIDGNLLDGQATFDLSSALPGARLTANGTLRPFEDVPSWQADGRIDELDLARLTGNPSRDVVLAGNFFLDAQGSSPETFSGEAGLRINRARYNEIQLGNSRLDASFRNGEVDFTTEAHLADGGRLQARGQAAYAEDPITYAISDGRFEHLDLESITGDSTNASDLTGRFSLNGRGIDPEMLTAQGELHLNDSRYSTYEITDFTANYRFANSRLAFDMHADLARAGQLTAQGTADPFADPIVLNVEGRTQNLNLAELTNNPAQISDFSGRYSARLRGLDAQSLTLNAHLELGPSSYGAQTIDDGTVDLVLQRGDLSLTGDLQTPEGLLAVDVSGRPFDEVPSFQLGDRTCFRGLNLRHFTDNPDLETDLNGCFHGQISGTDPKTATIDAVLSIQPSRLVDAEIEGGEAIVTLADGYLQTNATIAFPNEGTDAKNSTLHLSGRPFDEEPFLTGELQTRHLNLADFSPLLPGTSLPQSDLSISLDSLVLRGKDPKTMTVRARLQADGSRVGDVQIDTLRSAFRLEDGIATVDASRLRSNLMDATGGGHIALFDSTASTDYALEGRLNNVSLLSSVFDAPSISAEQGLFSLRMQGVPGHPFALEGHLEAGNVVYGDSAEFTAQQITSEITGEIEPNLKNVSLRGQTQFQDFRVPNMALPLRQGDLLLAFNNETGLTVEVSGRLDEERKISVAADVKTSETGTVLDLHAVNITLGSEDWYLARHAQIQLGDAIRIQNLLLRTGDNSQQIAADGRLDFDGEQRLIVTAENVDMKPFTDLIPPGGMFQVAGMGGTFWGTVFLQGPAANPELFTFLSVEDLTSEGDVFGSLHSRINYQDRRLSIDANLTHQSGQTLTVDGVLPQRLSLAGGEAELTEGEDDDSVHLVIHTETFPLAWARPFLNPDQYSDIGGSLTADSLVVSGTFSDLQLDGAVRLTEGRLGVTTTGVTFEPLEARLGFAGNRIILENVHIADPESGRRRLNVTGDITLENLNLGELDLTIEADRLLAMNNRTYRELVIGSGSQPLHLTGTLDAPELRGAVTLEEADIFMTDELVSSKFEAVQLSPEEIREVETLFGQVAAASDTSSVRFMDALAYNLDVEINRNVWLRSRARMPFDIEFEGTIDAQKQPFGGSNQLFGTIELVRGWVQMPGLPGKRFTVQEGTVTLNGNALAALMDLSATMETKLKRGSGQTPITITMNMTGRFNENPEVRLSSDPALDPADIISVIATGQLSQDIGTGAVGEVASGYGLGLLSGQIAGAASEALGLDMVELDVESDGTVVINLGKYLTERAFASVGYRIGNQEHSAFQNQSGVVVGFDYELLRWLMLKAEQGGQRGLGGGLNYEVHW